MKTLRVTLADIIGPTGTPNSTATVHARYVDTSGRGRDVHLTDGTIVVPVRRVAAADGDPEVFDFDVYANDVAPVREVDYGHLVEVSWTVVAPTGAKTSGVRRVAITDSMASVVQLGLLSQPEPVAPYTGGYALAPDLAAEVATRAAADAALDGRVDALEVAPPAHTHPLSDVTDAGTAAAADVGDFATAAQGILADSATQPADLATVATTGAYADLTGKPTLGTAAATAATDYATAAQGVTADGAAQKSANLSDLASASTARTNLGLGDSAVVGALPIPDPGSFYPTDTITAALQLIGGRELYGTGSPEGVVTATPGTEYLDTAGTCGAWRWIKVSGTGTTGWKVTYGDTGWRNMQAEFESICTANSLTFSVAPGYLPPKIRRVGDFLILDVGVNITGSGSGNIDFQSAFGQNLNGFTGGPFNRQIPASVTGSAGVIHWAANFIAQITYVKFWSPGLQTLNVVWPITDTAVWPTSLPGTPA